MSKTTVINSINWAFDCAIQDRCASDKETKDAEKEKEFLISIIKSLPSPTIEYHARKLGIR